jgi:large subunit ribosomal protein L3
MTGIIGRKLGMTRIFDENGTVVPVTVIEAGPCVVTQVKTKKHDGYEAVQLGFGTVRRKSLTKPELGHFDRAKLAPQRRLTEFRVSGTAGIAVGQEVKVDIFKHGDMVDVTGWSKGKGFQGVVKRHKHSGGNETHGCTSHRVPGSMGQSASPSRVWKGRKLPGRMGGERVTMQRLFVAGIDNEKNFLLIRGAVPGATNGFVLVKKRIAPGK